MSLVFYGIMHDPKIYAWCQRCTPEIPADAMILDFVNVVPVEDDSDVEVLKQLSDQTCNCEYCTAERAQPVANPIRNRFRITRRRNMRRRRDSD
jgi:hypothetical protein